MAITASKLVNQAQSWIGCKESNGSHKKIIDLYNTQKPLPRGYKMKYTDEWCATFVSACAIACNATDIIPTECSCEKMINLAKAKGIWQENENVTPAPGWIIMYDWQDNGVGDNKGWADHVGIVEKVQNGIITVIEGNMSEAVGRRNLHVNAKYIRGFIKPNYKAESKPTAPTTPTSKTTLELVVEVMQGKHGTGVVRSKSLGSRYSEVQGFINHIYNTDTKTLATEAINGKYGNDEIRKIVLGSRYAEVQREVNSRY